MACFASISPQVAPITSPGSGFGQYVAHGFRSSFRDWAAETTKHDNHVVEMALAHVIGKKVEAAYSAAHCSKNDVG